MEITFTRIINPSYPTVRSVVLSVRYVETQRRVQEGSTFVLTDIPGNAAVHVLKGTTVVEIIVAPATAMMRLIHLRSTR
jgi:hypothetical protein